MKRNQRTRGLTLIEVMIAGTILLIVIATALSLFIDANESVGDSFVLTDAAMEANRAQALLKQELRTMANTPQLGSTGAGGLFAAGSANQSPIGEATSIQYSSLNRFDIPTQTKIFNPRREIRFVYDPAESGGTGDDIDNDRDGRVDEGSLLLLQDMNANGILDPTNERVAVLVKNVSSDDFAIRNPPGRITITLTTIIRAGTIGARDPGPDTLMFTADDIIMPNGNDGTAAQGGMTRTLEIAMRN